MTLIGALFLLEGTSESNGNPVGDVFWVAVIGLLGTLVAGLFGPWVQAITTRRAEVRSRINQEKLEFTRAIIHDLGELSEISRWEEPDEWRVVHSRLERTVTNLELIIPPSEHEIGAVVSVGVMYINPGESSLAKSSAQLSQFALLNYIKAWYFGRAKAKGLVNGFMDSVVAIRESLLRGDMKVNGEPLRDDELTAEELEERKTLGVSFPASNP